MRLVILLLVVAGCGAPIQNAQYRGEPLVTVRGQLREAPSRPVSGPVSLAMVWLTPGTAPRLPALSVTQWAESTTSTSRFDWVAFTLPPSEARVRSESQTVMADGVLVVYQDRNGTGALELDGATTPSPDLVLGASLGSPSAPKGYHLSYVDGELPSSPSGLAQGFNLVETASGVSSFSSEVPIELTGLDVLSGWLCTVAERCAPSAKSVLKVVGSVGRSENTASVIVTVRDDRGPVAQAQVTLNGHPVAYNAAKARYDLEEPAANLQSVNRLLVTLSGAADLALDVPLVGALTILEPAVFARLPAGAPFKVRWSAPVGASKYRVRVFDANFQTIASIETAELSTMVTLPASTLSATLSAEVLLPDITTPEGSFISPYVNAGRGLLFQ